VWWTVMGIGVATAVLLALYHLLVKLDSPAQAG